MLILRNDDVRSILRNLSHNDLLCILSAFSRTLREFSVPSSEEAIIYQPIRASISTSLGHTTLFMPSSNTVTTGIKVVSIPAQGGGLPSALTIFTPDGKIVGLLNSGEITGFRTALASMVIFARREWQGAGSIVVFGAGKQAEWHIRLALMLSPQTIGRVTVINRSKETLDALKADIFPELEIEYPNVAFTFVAKAGNASYESELEASLFEAVAIFCCTPTSDPLFPYSYLENAKTRNKYLSLIGSYKPHMKEVDSRTVRSGDLLCVDDKEACLEESGELIGAKVTKEELVEIGALLSKDTGELTGADEDQLAILRTSNVIFKCVGIGIMDVVVGSILLDFAKAQCIGIPVADF
ncbi:hypothetical protein V493_04557 [Pseudogymnoascus sp. VKM F-4281 (FW-2241)]|nr:hypothetical protein V493_04557 [Pseudogymnoascus sp. VKM F-4281 (FW-2241)]